MCRKPNPKKMVPVCPQPFVVKLTHTSLKKAQATTEQEREISLMKELAQSKHPNILKLLGWRGTHFNMQLIFELYDQYLRKYVNGKPLHLRVSRKLSHDVFRAVACVHSHCILHRDIKPPNILVRNQPLAAILGDFGCARNLLPNVEGASQQQPLTQDVCTLWYRAPEILLSNDNYGYASDVWSVGVVMVEMHNGIPSFRRSSEIGMLFDMFNKLGTPTWSKELTAMRDFRGVLGTCALAKFPCPEVFPFGSPGQDQDVIRAASRPSLLPQRTYQCRRGHTSCMVLLI
jgi:serine/threonine protein kinase